MKMFLFGTIIFAGIFASAQSDRTVRDACIRELQTEVDKFCHRSNALPSNGKANKYTVANMSGAITAFTDGKERIARICATACPEDIASKCARLIGTVESDLKSYFMTPGKKSGPYAGTSCSNVQAALDQANNDPTGANRAAASTDNGSNSAGANGAAAAKSVDKSSVRKCNPFDERGNRILGACD